jgi:uncharacterized protein (TIGR04540 family)
VEIKLFYKTQRELASALNIIVDAYWENTISEEELFKNVSNICMNNGNKIIKKNDFTTILKQTCGKRRLEVIMRILQMNGTIIDNLSAM